MTRDAEGGPVGDVRRDAEGAPVGDVITEIGVTGLVVSSACVFSWRLDLGSGSVVEPADTPWGAGGTACAALAVASEATIPVPAGHPAAWTYCSKGRPGAMAGAVVGPAAGQLNSTGF